MADGPNRAHVALSRIAPRQLLRLKSWLPRNVASPAPAIDALALPMRVGEIVGTRMRVLCLGPGEWLAIAPAGSIGAAQLRDRDAQMASQGIALVDASHALEGWLLQGAAAREVLAVSCGVDVHPARFPPGRCVRTRFTQIAAVIVHRDDGDGYELLVARSHADYLHDWLEDALSLTDSAGPRTPGAVSFKVAS